MTKLWKLTDQNHQTRNATQWGEGVEHTADGEGGLCGPGWLHAYESKELATLLNPIHANIEQPVLWEAEGDVGKRDRGLKVGCTILRTVQIVSLVEYTTTQRVAFGILCAKEVYEEKSFQVWATGWLSNQNRSSAVAADAAAVAARAARDAARAGVYAATVAADAARAAATVAADAAADAADTARAAADAAADAADTARAAARAAADAARAGVYAAADAARAGVYAAADAARAFNIHALAIKA